MGRSTSAYQQFLIAKSISKTVLINKIKSVLEGDISLTKKQRINKALELIYAYDKENGLK